MAISPADSGKLLALKQWSQNNDVDLRKLQQPDVARAQQQTGISSVDIARLAAAASTYTPEANDIGQQLSGGNATQAFVPQRNVYGSAVVEGGAQLTGRAALMEALKSAKPPEGSRTTGYTASAEGANGVEVTAWIGLGTGMEAKVDLSNPKQWAVHPRSSNDLRKSMTEVLALFAPLAKAQGAGVVVSLDGKQPARTDDVAGVAVDARHAVMKQLEAMKSDRGGSFLTSLQDGKIKLTEWLGTGTGLEGAFDISDAGEWKANTTKVFAGSREVDALVALLQPLAKRNGASLTVSLDSTVDMPRVTLPGGARVDLRSEVMKALPMSGLDERGRVRVSAPNGSVIGHLDVSGDGKTWKATAERWKDPKKVAEVVGPVAKQFGATVTVDAAA